MTDMEWDTTAPGAQTGQAYEVLPTGEYTMKIADARVEADELYGKPDANGEYPKKLVLKWETHRLTPEQEQAGIGLGEPVWQRFNTYYGTVKDGSPSKFKSFVDGLIKQGVLPPKFKASDFEGIVQRVSVEEYTKTMGPNTGKPGNRVAAVAPLQLAPRRRSIVPDPPIPDTDQMPFGGPAPF